MLDWAGQEYPDGGRPDSRYKVSAQALQNRGLVKVTKRSGHWSAHLTDKGRQHLTKRGIRPVEQNAEPPGHPGRNPAPSHPKAVPKARTNFTDHATNWASRLNAARKSGKIPRTQELYGCRAHRGYEIKLVDILAWRLAELTPLSVPSRLTKPRSVVAALQKQPQPMGPTNPVQG
ncbi:hypothetical protein ACFWZ2_17035 [Streptomyces sp. NPDC059002]|uniref:hypothetical protein n=1 Tax=Streptomyces sp. NPDC059002 TaxID=3346690 RepID=UPI003678F0B4